MMQAWHWTWATVAFASELAALAGIAVGALALPFPTPVRVAVAVAAPVAAAVVWGLFAAPSAPVQGGLLATAAKLLVYGSAVLALAASGHPRLAAVLAAAAVLGSVLSGPPSALVTPAAS